MGKHVAEKMGFVCESNLLVIQKNIKMLKLLNSCKFHVAVTVVYVCPVYDRKTGIGYNILCFLKSVSNL